MNAFLDPKDIATKKGEVTSGTLLYCHAKFQSWDKNTQTAADLIRNH